MRTLATTLVTVQEISEDLNAGLALENLHGEYFYVNESWPQYIQLFDSGKMISDNSASAYPVDLHREIKNAGKEILINQSPVGYIITTKNQEAENLHFLLKFAIHYTTGEPFCFCVMAKQIQDKSQFSDLLDKVRQVFPFSKEPGLKFLSNAAC